MQRNIKPCYYSEYLQLDKLLDAQHPVSPDYGTEAHDETLFIITHQAYELWFKQILHELKSVMGVFSGEDIAERELGEVEARLNRIHSIQRVLIEQIGIMETMTPLDFLDFRDYLIPASGFQSIQFKQIEIMLGLKSKYRINFDKDSFYSRLREKDRNMLLQLEERESLFDQVDRWLKRMPFLKFGDFDFWQEYGNAVHAMLEADRETIRTADYMTDAEKMFQLTDLDTTGKNFQALLDPDQYEEIREQGGFRMRQQALLSAVFIHLYRDEPILQLPFRVLTALITVDELFTTWRYRHAIMVHRMLGTKIGTGGSSGHDYLRETTQNNRFFPDLFKLSTFLLPRSALPKLPESLTHALGFYFSHSDDPASPGG